MYPHGWLSGLPDPISAAEDIHRQPRWPHIPQVQKQHQDALFHLARLDFGSPPVARGDGIVTCGGGRFWPMLVVAARMLRDVSSLPMQIWHRGQTEPVDPDDLTGTADIELCDSTLAVPRPRILRGWEQKAVALLHCPFRRVLFLDADAYLLADPIPLLDLATQRNFVYWIDQPRMGNNVNWPAVGINQKIGRSVPPVQGGQFTMDRLSFWRELSLFYWINMHSDYFYSHMYGDQDAWRIILSMSLLSTKAGKM